MKELDLKASGAFGKHPMVSIRSAANSIATVFVELVGDVDKWYNSQDDQVSEPTFESLALHTEDHSDAEPPAVFILDLIDIHVFIKLRIRNVSYVFMPLHKEVIFL